MQFCSSCLPAARVGAVVYSSGVPADGFVFSPVFSRLPSEATSTCLTSTSARRTWPRTSGPSTGWRASRRRRPRSEPREGDRRRGGEHSPRLEAGGWRVQPPGSDRLEVGMSSFLRALQNLGRVALGRWINSFGARTSKRVQPRFRVRLGGEKPHKA